MPEASYTHSSVPPCTVPEKVTSMLGWVEAAEKISAMPLAPAAITLPPVIAPLPL